jgi:poly(3-hydroxybutyrate) depolymerase
LRKQKRVRIDRPGSFKVELIRENYMPAVQRFFRSCARVLLLLAGALALSQNGCAAGSAISIATGAGRFVFADAKGDVSKPVTVYTYLPTGVKPESAPIVFVMHGFGKDAKGNRDMWMEHANRNGFMVFAPLFDPAQWGKDGYAYASVIGKDGSLRDPSLWSYSAIEHLFDAIKEATGNGNPTYDIFGHSEGGQFVHRLVMLLPDARYARAVAANPGWYTMPDFNVKFPYGLGASPATEASLKKSFARDFVLMLGDRDTDPNHRALNRSPQAMAQGAFRFERGQKYFKEAQIRAAQLQSAFKWRLQIVPGVAHQTSRMARPAAAVLMER